MGLLLFLLPISLVLSRISNHGAMVVTGVLSLCVMAYALWRGIVPEIPRWWQAKPSTFRAGIILIGVGVLTGLLRGANVVGSLRLIGEEFMLPMLAVGSVSILWFKEGRVQRGALLAGMVVFAVLSVAWLFHAGFHLTNWHQNTIASLHLVFNYPMSGIGFGNFAPYYARELAHLQPGASAAGVQQTTILFISWWLNLGFLGFLGLCLTTFAQIQQNKSAKIFILPLVLFLLTGFVTSASFTFASAYLWWLVLLLPDFVKSE